MKNWIGAAIIAGAFTLALPASAAVVAPNMPVRATDFGAQRHHHLRPYRPHYRSYYRPRPAYYARPSYYRPYPYYGTAPFSFGFGPDIW